MNTKEIFKINSRYIGNYSPTKYLCADEVQSWIVEYAPKTKPNFNPKKPIAQLEAHTEMVKPVCVCHVQENGIQSKSKRYTKQHAAFNQFTCDGIRC